MNIMYLRKSRADIANEKSLGIDTLRRHREILVELSKKQNILIDKVYEEVVSGESIASRPEIQKLLSDVELEQDNNVLVMEVERLARGDSIDQGIIARTFQYTNTRIVTPIKTYDPNNEFDSEYFEFGLFMSRREYKTINRRITNGRIKSVKEGRYIGSITPFGYDKEKLPDKGFKLVPNADADTVSLIYNLLINENKGTSKIAHYLNDTKVKSKTNALWTPAMVRTILINKVYCGYLTWGRRKTVKNMKNKMIEKSHPISDDYIEVKGLHSPIISEKTFYKAQNILLANRSRTYRNDYKIQNPLAGIIRCSKCGHKMTRRPYKNSQPDSLICSIKECKNVSSQLSLVESKLLKSLEQKFKEYDYFIDNYSKEIKKIQYSNEQNMKVIDKEIEKIKKQQNKAYELVETGVYDITTYKERKTLLDNDLKKLLNEKENIKNNNELNNYNRIKEVIPIMKKQIKVYEALTIEEKNNLLKKIIKEVIYNKDKGGKGLEDNFSLEIELNI